MRRALLPLLRCLRCRYREFILTAEREADEIETGSLRCTDCGTTYPIERGVLLMLQRSSPTMTREMEGWHRFAEDEQWSTPPDGYLLWLPRPRVPIPTDTLHWEWHADNFELGLSLADWSGKLVLDLAAGRCWTTRHLAERSATCVATDMMTTENIGLDTGRRYIEHTGVHFERVVCSMLDLPFADAVFDVAFAYASLHHSEDLQRSLAEAVRVLKPGGRIVLAGEPVGRFYERLHRWFGRNRYGIHETSPRLAEWLRALRRAGITEVTIVEDAVFARHSRHPFDRVFRPLARRWPRAYVLKLRWLGGVLVLQGARAGSAEDWPIRVRLASGGQS